VSDDFDHQRSFDSNLEFFRDVEGRLARVLRSGNCVRSTHLMEDLARAFGDLEVTLDGIAKVDRPKAARYVAMAEKTLQSYAEKFSTTCVKAT
jgi:hypothetical protein